MMATELELEQELKPEWARANDLELSVCGKFYQGYVDNYTSVLAQHCVATVSTFGVRKSRKNVQDKENEASDKV
jgi:hypothetical protein